MKLTKKRLQRIIKEELSLLEANSGISPETGREWFLSSTTGKKHWAGMPGDDDRKGSSQTDDGSIPVETDQEVNKDGDAYWVMRDDLTTSLRNNRVESEQSESDETELYIMTGQAEGITVKILRRGR